MRRRRPRGPQIDAAGAEIAGDGGREGRRCGGGRERRRDGDRQIKRRCADDPTAERRRGVGGVEDGRRRRWRQRRRGFGRCRSDPPNPALLLGLRLVASRGDVGGGGGGGAAMDSEDDMLDANDSADDDFYSGRETWPCSPAASTPFCQPPCGGTLKNEAPRRRVRRGGAAWARPRPWWRDRAHRGYEPERGWGRMCVGPTFG
uniref:Uncharacterized protein n=1 Tax=Oryza meridionalis TaxID=40149 RepID=A0A0E0DGV2_9ORYZ